jgi:hypothetical protein
MMNSVLQVMLTILSGIIVFIAQVMMLEITAA